MEKWKDVIGYEGFYEVSDQGQIRTNKDRTIYSTRWDCEVKRKQVIKTPRVSKRDNTCYVNLWKNGERKTFSIHRLVGDAFICKPDYANQINHIDGNRKNNSVDNLEWCNNKENMNHAFDNGLINTGIKVMFVDKNTNESICFRSISKANQFLGRSNNYLNKVIKGQRQNTTQYDIHANDKIII